MHSDNEYLMLREEIMYNLNAQQKCSTFAITATITIIGFALQSEKTAIPEIFLVPFIVLILSAVKVSNYKTGIEKIVSYLEVKHERNSEFSWETSLGELRRFEAIHENKYKRLARELMETQEFSLMGIVCLVLYIAMFIKSGYADSIARVAGFSILSVLLIIFMVVTSMNYWNLTYKEIKDYIDIWNEILN